ncbi:MAG: 2-hydroxyacyl-CoA dehydratase family protein [Chloroflexota bacterium]|nr:2-hydroxyacyl-CoA dehydratase family protein [Chloroflexota bacterium]
MTTPKTTALKSTETARQVRPLVKKMYARGLEARERGQTVAYVMVGTQCDELLWALDVVPIWTENYAGLCAAKRVAQPFIVKAEAEGYSNLICGYARTGIGFDAMRAEQGGIPPEAPDGGMAEPDLLIGCSHRCDPRFKWYQALGRYKETPLFNFDIVYPGAGTDLKAIREYYIQYQKEQFAELVAFLEQHTGRKLDKDRLRQIVTRAEEIRRLWWDAYELRRALPCPMPGQDHFNIFVPHHFMIGEEDTLNFYRDLYQELKQRVDQGLGAIANEKYRLLWGGGLPPWHSMIIFIYLESLGAVVVREATYRPPEPMEMNPGEDPLEFMARRSFDRYTWYHQRALEWGGDPEAQLLLDWIKDYRADGIVMHASKSCRATTIGQIHFKNMLQEHAGVPSLFLESDIVDVRDYSEAQTKLQIDAFMETVAHSKKG